MFEEFRQRTGSTILKLKLARVEAQEFPDQESKEIPWRSGNSPDSWGKRPTQRVWKVPRGLGRWASQLRLFCSFLGCPPGTGFYLHDRIPKASEKGSKSSQCACSLVCFFVCLFVCLLVCLFVCPSIQYVLESSKFCEVPCKGSAYLVGTHSFMSNQFRTELRPTYLVLFGAKFQNWRPLI